MCRLTPRTRDQLDTLVRRYLELDHRPTHQDRDQAWQDQLQAQMIRRQIRERLPELQAYYDITVIDGTPPRYIFEPKRDTQPAD